MVTFSLQDKIIGSSSTAEAEDHLASLRQAIAKLQAAVPITESVAEEAPAVKVAEEQKTENEP